MKQSTKAKTNFHFHFKRLRYQSHVIHSARDHKFFFQSLCYWNPFVSLCARVRVSSTPDTNTNEPHQILLATI